MPGHDNKRILHVLVTSCVCAFLGILPWWLFAKYILGIDLSSPSITRATFIVFLVMWIAVSGGRMLRETPETERERVSYKFALGYGKFLLVMVGIQFLLVIGLLVAGLIGK